MRQVLAAGCVLLAAAAVWSSGARAQEARADGPRFSAANELIKPADFREWVFVASGLGMTYATPERVNPSPNFTNVYVNPSSYRGFMTTGQWPDQTMFVLEIRSSASEGSREPR